MEGKNSPRICRSGGCLLSARGGPRQHRSVLTDELTTLAWPLHSVFTQLRVHKVHTVDQRHKAAARHTAMTHTTVPDNALGPGTILEACLSAHYIVSHSSSAHEAVNRSSPWGELARKLEAIQHTCASEPSRSLVEATHSNMRQVFPRPL